MSGSSATRPRSQRNATIARRKPQNPWSLPSHWRILRSCPGFLAVAASRVIGHCRCRRRGVCSSRTPASRVRSEANQMSPTGAEICQHERFVQMFDICCINSGFSLEIQETCGDARNTRAATETHGKRGRHTRTYSMKRLEENKINKTARGHLSIGCYQAAVTAA